MSPTPAIVPEVPAVTRPQDGYPLPDNTRHGKECQACARTTHRCD